MSSIKQEKDKNQHIQVFVRVRPLNTQEKNAKSHGIVDCPNNREVVVKDRLCDRYTKTFAFDRVFGPSSKQIDVYMSVVRPMITEVLAGYNCTVFAYGQTGTGKTYTMEGEKSRDSSMSWENDPQSGIIPRTLSNIFDELRIQQVEFTVRVSFLELYNEELIDLLSPPDDTSKIRLFEDAMKKGSVIIQGLEEVAVHNKEEVYSIMEKGSYKRQTACTLMNAQSSRSHTVFSITVHIKENSLEGEELLKIGKLNLVDLAGSENIGRSGAMDKRAREAGNINQSLLTLGRVITALVERAPHVPYRESKLTRLLQDSLGGRTKTSIIATVSPAACNVEETLSTLDYAHRSKNITNRPEINQKLTKKSLIKEYTGEIERLRKDLQAARDKNGVYIATENYTQMILQLEHQEKEISEMLSRMKALKEEMDKKEEICAELKMSLGVCKEQLTATSNDLEVTKTKLNTTSVKLSETLFQCSEKEHLIEKRIQTESALTEQAQTLLAVADAATSDTVKLHDTLARKRSVENNNQDVGREFHTFFVQNVIQMEGRLSHFTQDLIKFLSGLQTNIGECLERRSQELTSLSNEMSSLVENQVQQIQDFVKISSNQVHNDQQWVQQHLTSLRSTSDSEVNTLHKFLTDTFLVPMGTIARFLQLQEDKIESLVRMFTDQINEKLEATRNYEASYSNVLTQLKDSIILHSKQQQQALNTSQAGYYGLEKSQNELKETLMAEVQQLRSSADRIMKMHAEFENQCVVDKEKIVSGLTVAREKSDILSQHVPTTLNLELSRIAEQRHVYEEQTEELLDSVSSSVEANKQLMTDTRKLLFEDIEVGVRSAVSDGERAWRNHYSWAEQALRKLSGSINEGLQCKLKQSQTMVGELRDSAESFESLLEQQRIDFNTFVGKHQDVVQTECSYVNEWSQTMLSSLQRRNQELDKFLVEDLQKDLPTGNTPQRKEFSYPRILAATSPHERILARFREVNDSPALNSGDLNLNNTVSSSQSTSSIATNADSIKGAEGDDDSGMYRSVSTSNIPNTAESVLNLSMQSEPGSLRQSDNKENPDIAPLKKYKSQDMKDARKPTFSRKILQPHN